MNNKNESPHKHCLNCSAPAKGDFCHDCGQSIRDNSDRSLSRLLGEVFGNIFFLDNRILLSAKYLFLSPGRMTVEFLKGKRKKFISPITLFLFINLIYFFVNPLSDYSVSFDDQIHLQPYSTLIKDWADLKLQMEGLNQQAYGIIYQSMSDNISKSIMIVNVPIIAIFVYLMSFKKRQFYFDSLIFSFHFFSLFMFSWVMSYWVNALIGLFPDLDNSIVSEISFNLFAFVIPLIYAILSMRKFMDIKWYWAIPAGIGVMAAVTLTNLFYRFIIFVVTVWAT